jgi:hypothetical protein
MNTIVGFEDFFLVPGTYRGAPEKQDDEKD